MEMKTTEKRVHRLVLTERKLLKAEGVDEVISFDPQEVLLRTAEGKLTIRGSGLHVNGLSLEQGTLEVTGSVNSLVYADKKNGDGESLLRRFFK